MEGEGTEGKGMGGKESRNTPPLIPVYATGTGFLTKIETEVDVPEYVLERH